MTGAPSGFFVDSITTGSSTRVGLRKGTASALPGTLIAPGGSLIGTSIGVPGLGGVVGPETAAGAGFGALVGGVGAGGAAVGAGFGAATGASARGGVAGGAAGLGGVAAVAGGRSGAFGGGEAGAGGLAATGALGGAFGCAPWALDGWGTTPPGGASDITGLREAAAGEGGRNRPEEETAGAVRCGGGGGSGRGFGAFFKGFGADFFASGVNIDFGGSRVPSASAGGRCSLSRKDSPVFLPLCLSTWSRRTNRPAT